MTIINNFTFVVLTYNHSNYILEHLESIKYLIDNYGNGIAVDIIVADDASRDDTVALTKFWVEKNSYLFRRITVLSDGTNRGTCKNLTLALENLATDYCKLTAGDDVYSYENLFFEAKKIYGNHILSGLPLNLINGTIVDTQFDLFNLFATNIIYKNSPYLVRLQRINFFNSPSIFYTASALLNKDIINFVNQYSVTEDYPLQIKMAEIYKPLKFVQVEKIFVYYRRTANSTYLVKNSQFNRDKVDIFNYLIKSESNIFGKLLLRNRLFCYNLGNRYLKKAFNLSFYLYGFGVLKNIIFILNKVKKFDKQLDKHQSHYDLMALNARNYNI
ncbi:MAG: glycosyltransferase family 2 protein [Rhodoferax sp.]|uniref:glycosyltransferase family A protein n=1 Tax=Rhodoferax sp. TaxID=50421 RepID=UPI00271D1C0C|nr:glycosyltransferase family 2 protein [Rhodoferax sp.]MDO8450270.1 glycosyltransferase family 2 protein [Rhodoferax sp.]